MEEKNSDDDNGRTPAALAQGEMTLEEFLMTAGALPPPPTPTSTDQQHHHQLLNLNQSPASSLAVDDATNWSPEPDTTSQSQTAATHKRAARGYVVGLTAEQKKQKRIFKNRESAERSRLRKQAYLEKVEAERDQLKEENERLKKELRTEKERVLSTVPPPDTKDQLRPTSSAPF